MSTAQTGMVKRQEGQCEHMWGVGGGELSILYSFDQ